MIGFKPHSHAFHTLANNVFSWGEAYLKPWSNPGLFGSLLAKFGGGIPNGSRASYGSRPFAGGFWRPSLCQNQVQDSSLERYLSLLSNPIRIFQFGVDLTCQKSNLPRLVKKCLMRLPQGRVMLQSTFKCLPQPPIEIMIAHWKDICV